jgi:hypothetical protein
MADKKRYGIYIVEESYSPEGLWQGYKCSAAASTGKQGKLYIKSDGREFYKSEPKKDEELEI